MRIMGLDVGDKTIGVAVSDEMLWTAQGLEVIRRKSEADDFQRLSELVQEYDVGLIVVGLPKNMDNTIGPRGEICIEFARMAEQKLKVPVRLWDERLTTVSATKALLEADVSRRKRKKVIDMVAANMILQSYLDYRQRAGDRGGEKEDER
jgi:putative Holliday junction resolvase